MRTKSFRSELVVHLSVKAESYDSAKVATQDIKDMILRCSTGGVGEMSDPPRIECFDAKATSVKIKSITQRRKRAKNKV